MTTAKANDEIVMTFTVTLNDGRVVGGTEKDGPLTLKLGEGKIFPQVEEALVGMKAGEEKSVAIPAESAFGPRREELVIQIPRSDLPPGQEPKPGMQLQTQAPGGQTVSLVITEVGEETVTVDGNHPLAGEDLHFKITLVEIKPAA